MSGDCKPAIVKQITARIQVERKEGSGFLTSVCPHIEGEHDLS
jgi:hypothetical protein